MSIFGNPKKVLKNTLFFEVSDENALKHRKSNFNFVMIKKSVFCKKDLGVFYIAYIYND
jgi:hypothetical protein